MNKKESFDNDVYFEINTMDSSEVNNIDSIENESNYNFNEDNEDTEKKEASFLKFKDKKKVYLTSSVICSLTGVLALGNVFEKQKDTSDTISNKSSEVIPKVNSKATSATSKDNTSKTNNGKTAVSEKTDKATKVEMVEDEVEKKGEFSNEEDLKKAIEVAKARSIESQKNAPVEKNVFETVENLAEVESRNIEYYSYNLESQSASSPPVIQVGQAMTSNSVTNAMRYWNYFEYYGYTYGIDPYLLVAMSCQESRGDHYSTITGGKYYNGAGYGIMQIEKPGVVTKKITAYNHTTKSYDVMYINSEKDVYDVSLNIKAGAMILAQRAKEQQYNPYVTIQGYNYGASGIKYTIAYYLAEGDLTKIEDIYNNGKGSQLLAYISSNNNEWLDKVLDSGMTARQWYSSIGWKRFGAGRGDKEYIEKVMRFYNGNGRPYILKDTGERINF